MIGPTHSCQVRSLLPTDFAGWKPLWARYEKARGAGIGRVYWHTHESSAAGRLLYDKVAKHAGLIVYGQEV